MQNRFKGHYIEMIVNCLFLIRASEKLGVQNDLLNGDYCRGK